MKVYKRATMAVCVGEITLKTDVITNFAQVSDAITAELMATGRAEKKFDMAPYFALIWDAARGLLATLAEKPDSFFVGKTICEIGCGLALPSIYCAKRGAKVIATDFHPDVPVFLYCNIEQNGITPGDHFKYLEIDWRNDPLAMFNYGPIDVLIGSDILYDKARADSVADFLNVAVSGTRQAIIADSGRPYVDGFKKRCESFGLSISEEIFQVLGQGSKPTNINIMTIAMPGA